MSQNRSKNRVSGLLGLTCSLVLAPQLLATECLLDSFSTHFGQADPAVAADPSGDFRTIWSQPPLTSGTGRADDIVVRRFNSDCLPVGPPIVPTSTLTGAFPDHSNPSIAITSAGQISLGWTVLDQDGGLLSATWQSNTINPLILRRDYEDVVVRNSDGGVVESVRTGLLDGGETSDVFFRELLYGFERLSAEPCGTFTCSNHSPALDLDDSGGVATVWLERLNADESPQEAVVARIFPDLAGPTGNIRVTPSYDSFEVSLSRPRVARSNDPGAVNLVTWSQRGPGFQPQQVLARIYSSNGLPLTDEFVVGQGGGAAPIAFGNQFVVVWVRGQDILSRSFDLSGNQLTPETAVSELAGDKGHPALERYGNGLLAVWESETASGDSGIYATTDILPEMTPTLHLALNEGVGRFASDRSGHQPPSAVSRDSLWRSALVDEGLTLADTDRIELETSLVPANGSRGTYSVWLRSESRPDGLGWVMSEQLSAGNKSWALAVHNYHGHPGVLCQKNVTTGGGPFWIDAPVDRTVIGAWTHVAVVFDQGETRVYVDGVREKTGDECGSFGHPIDRFTVGAFGAADGFAGDIDEIKYFAEPLTDGQVGALFQATLAEAATIETLPPVQSAASVVRTGPDRAQISLTTDEITTLHIEFGPGAELGAEADWSPQAANSHSRSQTGLAPDLPYELRLTSFDVAGNASRQTLSLSGSAQPTETVHLPLDEGSGNQTLELISGVSQAITGTPAWSVGPLGSALDIGQGERITVPGAFVAAHRYASYSLWIKPDAILSNNQFLISESVGGSNAGWALVLREHTGRLSAFFQSADGITNSPFQVDGPVIPPGQWTHVAVSFAPGVTTLYVNGVKVADGPTGGGFQPNQNLLVIGGPPHEPIFSVRYRGELDDIRVFDLPINEAKAASLFALGSP